MPDIITASKLKFRIYSGPARPCKICNEKKTTGMIARRLIKSPVIHFLYWLFQARRSIFVCCKECETVYKADPENDFFTEIQVNGTR